MNFVILTNKDEPTQDPLLFITPDTVHASSVYDKLPARLREKYRVHCLSSDTPTVCGTAEDIAQFMADGEPEDQG